MTTLLIKQMGLAFALVAGAMSTAMAATSTTSSTTRPKVVSPKSRPANWPWKKAALAT